MSDIFDMEQRIHNLEIKVLSLMSLDSAISVSCKPRHDKKSVPKGWLYISQFSDRYKFISSTRLCRLLNENRAFFNGNTLRIGGRVYLDPVKVAMFCENDLLKSTRLENQYRNWKGASEDLLNLSNEALERMTKNSEAKF